MDNKKIDFSTARTILLIALIATIVTLTIRLTLYTDDCNLLVLAATWLIIFAAAYLLARLIHRICKGAKAKD